MNYIKLNKELSYILRHNPHAYGLELDEYGFVSIEKLLASLNQKNHYKEKVQIEDLIKSIELSNKKRLEIDGQKIRALYGHSASLNIFKEEATPPEILYHGTSHKNLEGMLKFGIQSMSRLYVHLSLDIETALLVGKRRDENPVLLVVDTKKARQAGVKFYKGNETVWLSTNIPADCFTMLLEKEN